MPRNRGHDWAMQSLPEGVQGMVLEELLSLENPFEFLQEGDVYPDWLDKLLEENAAASEKDKCYIRGAWDSYRICMEWVDKNTAMGRRREAYDPPIDLIGFLDAMIEERYTDHGYNNSLEAKVGRLNNRDLYRYVYLDVWCQSTMRRIFASLLRLREVLKRMRKVIDLVPETKYAWLLDTLVDQKKESKSLIVSILKDVCKFCNNRREALVKYSYELACTVSRDFAKRENMHDAFIEIGLYSKIQEYLKCAREYILHGSQERKDRCIQSARVVAGDYYNLYMVPRYSGAGLVSSSEVTAEFLDKRRDRAWNVYERSQKKGIHWYLIDEIDGLKYFMKQLMSVMLTRDSLENTNMLTQRIYWDCHPHIVLRSAKGLVEEAEKWPGK